MEDVVPNDAPGPAPRSGPPARNIVLIGFMACGKTTIGRRCAKAAGMNFIDTDHEIEAEAGMSIPRIFKGEGEEGFRRRESETLRRLAKSDGCVIATGGGIVTIPENHPLLRQLGFVVWLNASRQAILDRATRNPKRPLLQTADPERTVAELLAKRMPLYERVADLQIETHDLAPDEVVAGILESARYFFSGFQREAADKHPGGS